MPDNQKNDHWLKQKSLFPKCSFTRVHCRTNSIETDSTDVEISYKGNKKVLKGTFDNLKKIKLEKIPLNIDREKVYQVTSNTRVKLFEKLKDGRLWKKDSRTTWIDFRKVQYRDCYGG